MATLEKERIFSSMLATVVNQNRAKLADGKIIIERNITTEKI